MTQTMRSIAIRASLGVAFGLLTYLLIGVVFAPVGIDPEGEVLRRGMSLLIGGAVSFAPMDTR